MTINQFLTFFVGEANKGYEQALQGLTDAQFYFLPNENSVHIAFHAWHFARTEDNVINFICQGRKAPIWVRQGLYEKWGLPKVTQGTGMALAEARAMRLPSVDALLQYLKDVWADVEPYLSQATETDLSADALIQAFGNRPKMQQIGQTIIFHGADHLGQIKTLRTIQGLAGDTF
ncbi:MAG: DinB family protein [Chloroflexi bacterium]|nr:DinB family protein [Chloroflexota bacterium]